MQMSVTMIGKTSFFDDDASASIDWKWETDTGVGDGEALTEFAGRACYQSWDRPNPSTATNAGYLAHIQEVGHWSVMEHATVTFYIQGVSRSLTHELVRHRHLSPSQLSQRFVVIRPDVMVRSTDDFIVPPLFDNDDEAGDVLMSHWEASIEAYTKLLQRAEHLLMLDGVEGTTAKKRAREAARAVLPNMTPTAIVLTGNHRAWREMLMQRVQPQADAEIRQLAVMIFEKLVEEEPSLYQDLEILYGEDGSSLRRMSSGDVTHAAEVVWDSRLAPIVELDPAAVALSEDAPKMPENEERPGRVL